MRRGVVEEAKADTIVDSLIMESPQNTPGSPDKCLALLGYSSQIYNR